MINLALFASGNGTNAQRIIEYFNISEKVSVGLVLTNNPKAFVLKRAVNFNIPSCVFSRDDFYHSDKIFSVLNGKGINTLILAGFLWLVPQNLLQAYPGRIINIHPALLPQYGGKGMYGMHIHEAVLAAKEKESGITIHYVNEKYDEGQVIFQAKCPVLADDTPENLAARIHELEYRYFPEVIEKTCENF